MSIKNTSISNLNYSKELYNKKPNTLLCSTIFALKNKNCKHYFDHFSRCINNKKNNNNIYLDKKRVLSSKKIKKLIEENRIAKKNKYSIYNLKKNNNNPLFISFNKQSKQSLACMKNKIKNNISYDHINRFYTNTNKSSCCLRKNFTPDFEKQDIIKYNNNKNLHRNNSYSLKMDDKLINNILKEDNEYNNILDMNKKNNNKLLNKLYCYTARQNYNNMNSSDINENITTKLLKSMKKSINKNNTIHKLLKISNIQNNYKSDYVNYINNCSINNKLNSNYINNKKSNSYKDFDNSTKDKCISLLFENLIKSTSNLLDSMKEERETNTFIKELKTGNNRIFSSRFTYNMDNNDYTSDDFYIQLKKTKSMRSSYFTYKNNTNKNNGKNYNNKLSYSTFYII